jgi:hypothetical protein
MRRIALTVALLLAAMDVAFAWGPSGHSIIAEIAQRRLAPLTLQHVADLPVSGASRSVPADGVLDDDYRRKNLPVLDTQLSRAGLRLAKTLNDAFAKGDCPAGQE